MGIGDWGLGIGDWGLEYENFIMFWRKQMDNYKIQ